MADDSKQEGKQHAAAKTAFLPILHLDDFNGRPTLICHPDGQRLLTTHPLYIYTEAHQGRVYEIVDVGNSVVGDWSVHKEVLHAVVLDVMRDLLHEWSIKTQLFTVLDAMHQSARHGQIQIQQSVFGIFSRWTGEDIQPCPLTVVDLDVEFKESLLATHSKDQRSFKDDTTVFFSAFKKQLSEDDCPGTIYGRVVYLGRAYEIRGPDETCSIRVDKMERQQHGFWLKRPLDFETATSKARRTFEQLGAKNMVYRDPIWTFVKRAQFQAPEAIADYQIHELAVSGHVFGAGDSGVLIVHE